MFFLAARAEKGIRPSTLSVCISAIAYEHERAGHPSPTDDRSVKKTWRGIRRRLGTAAKKKEPLSAGDLQRMMEALPEGLTGVRDRALILLGFAGGFRRSELVALQHAHLRFVGQGLEAFLERSKTDQEQQGHAKMISYGSDPATCPVRAVKDWIELSSVVSGPLFRPINRHGQLGSRALTGHAVDRDRQADCCQGWIADARAFRALFAHELCDRCSQRRRRLHINHGPDWTRELEHGARVQPAQG